MFNLETSINAWRQRMRAGGIESREVLDELESHLREDMERQLRLGIAEEAAFTAASQRMGEAALLKVEFNKINSMNWNRRLAWSAWVLFVISFFVPALGATGLFGTSVMWGWQCASVSLEAWEDLARGDWHAFHLASFTLANVLMLASPLLLWKFLDKGRFFNWLRVSIFLAFALVGHYFLICLFESGTKDIKIGYYLWNASFLLLFLSSILRQRSRTPRLVETN